MKTTPLLLTLLVLTFIGCGTKQSGNTQMESTLKWQSSIRKNLSTLGHRNWILVVDKAFPAQNTAGMITINTDAELLEVLGYTLHQIDSSTHVKPIIYCDAELEHITSDQVSDIDAFRTALKAALGKSEPQVILHDSVFVKIDEASKLFKVLVLKTNGTIPYSSVFIQLDCKYWTADKEKDLRKAMKAGK